MPTPAPPLTALLNAINTVNAPRLIDPTTREPRPIAEAEAIFGDPSPSGFNQIGNTQVPFGTTKPEIYGTGQVLINYERADMTLLIDNTAHPIEAGSATNVSDVLPAINAAYGTNIQAADIIDAPIRTLPDGTKQATLNIQSTSYGYVGSAVIVFSDVPSAIALSDAITTTSLSGLTPPTAPG